MPQPENDGPLYRRWWKVWPSGCCLPCNSTLHPCRASVSQNKRRFRQDGFDLDLTYITKRIIVHGFPATGVEHIYRNPRSEVQRLLDKYHEGHYKVYNFTNEPGRAYPEHLFQGRVERYPFTDHTCPPLESVVDFCESAKAWLDMDEENVVSLHCKAGKGRAGIMASCLLVRLGNTADVAINKYDSTRVSNMKGLTVVNQRKWPFLYERLIKEVWGLQGRIGIVPGQDPDLRAPKPRATCLREISVQLQTATGKRNDRLLSNLSCVVYQQQPRGKTLVHRAKMKRVVPAEGEPGIVYAVALPRSAEVKGTFEVMFSAAVGVASTQREVMDLWWNTAFLAPEGGDQSFELLEMDVSPMKLKIRLEQASARVILRHTPHEAPSPVRHSALIREAAAPAPDDAGDVGQPGAQAPSAGPMGEGGGGNGESRPNVATAPGDQSMPESEAAKQEDGEAPLDQSEVPRDVDSSGDKTRPRDDGNVVRASPPPPSPPQPQPPPAEDRALSEEKEGSATGPSPAFPGPSPAGAISPAWTFEGRMSSSVSDRSARAVGDSRWSRAKMWASSQGVSSGGVSTPRDSESRKVDAPAPPVGADRGLGLRSKRRAAALRKRSGSAIATSGKNAFGSVTGLSMAVPTETVSATWNSVRQGRAAGESGARGAITPQGERRERGGCCRFSPQFETDSDSDDQVAVRASGFGRRRWRLGSGGGCGRGSGGRKEVLVGHEHLAKPGPAARSSSTKVEQRVMEMEMAFTEERRRWEEHRQCLETELDWALAARARAEARSEEDSARVEVLESRLSAWRSEYSVIERDVKQAVKLLEMSLSGLMSAESALRRWKGQIPEQAYEDVLSCLTKGDVDHKRVGPGRE